MDKATFNAKISNGKISVPDLGIHTSAIFNKEAELSIKNGTSHVGILEPNGINTDSGFFSFSEIEEAEAELLIGGSGTTKVSSTTIDNRGFLGQQPGDMDK
ncbi:MULTISPECIES: hypothetical protein [unclassified Flavobacterium]|jgi:hypothetical protein|uniref:hypothetical protein n=1 Tax=unclassified Flavobacterium TaxID=196869 RepID=UPI0027E2157D|nr:MULTISPECIES: hypothetical protein [unclassified Flavobacterium]MDQ6530024.1 hypothetical protein [Flavobacterium sp. LHD-85]WPO78873.1 hypothetical protein SCB73_00475 [Flavobacterium sp. KACC 22761]